MNPLMKKNKRETSQRRTLTSIFKEYCKHCSLHGFYYFYKSSNALVHFVWAVIILGSVVLCGYLDMMIFHKFVVDPTLTVIESTHYPMTEIAFPAVTICNPDVVYGPSTADITKILTSRGFNPSQISDFYRSFTEMELNCYSPAPYLKKMHELLEDLHMPLNNLLDLLKKPCEVLLVSCFWRSKSHNCSSMFREVFLFNRYCCQFDMTYFQSNAEVNTNFVSGMQANEALAVIVNGRKYLPDGNTTEGHALLYVFDEQDTITFLDNSLTITPASLFDVNIDVWVIDSSEYVKALAVKHRSCILQSDPTYGAGFYHGCLAAIIMRRVVEMCRCLPYHYKSDDLNIDIQKRCSWERLICVYETTAKVLGNMKSVIAESECYQRCDYVQYNTDVKYIRRQKELHDITESFSKISVHFNDDTCLKYRREVLYTWDQVLANLGGIFGLCLGGSIISLIELVWLVFELLFNAMRNFSKKKVVTKKLKYHDSVKISTVEKDLVGKYKFTH